MNIGIAADHGGFSLKEELKARLLEAGIKVKDFGAHNFEPEDDYPDLIFPMAKSVSEGEIDRGIAICGSGGGAGILANKFPWVRVALISDIHSAHQGGENDDMNVLCLGARITGVELAYELIEAFLAAQFIDQGRFLRRLEKVKTIEKGYPHE